MCMWVVVGQRENQFCGLCVDILNVKVESNKNVSSKWLHA